MSGTRQGTYGSSMLELIPRQICGQPCDWLYIELVWPTIWLTAPVRHKKSPGTRCWQASSAGDWRSEDKDMVVVGEWGGGALLEVSEPYIICPSTFPALCMIIVVWVVLWVILDIHFGQSPTGEDDKIILLTPATSSLTLLYTMVASQSAKVRVDNHHIKVTSQSRLK